MPDLQPLYPGGLKKALTLSYDDGVVADRRMVAIMNEHGIKGAFHINAGMLGGENGRRLPAEEIAGLYAGQEVSAHTYNHPWFARCPQQQIVHELIDDRRRLESLVGYLVRGMSYPYGSHSAEVRAVLPYVGIEYARVVETTGGFQLPTDWLEWRTTCHHKNQLMERAERYAAMNQKHATLFSVWGHSYEFDNDQNWELLEQFCAYIGGRDDIWYATNIQLVDYWNAYRQLRFSAAMDQAYNPGVQDVWVSVDGSAVEVKAGTLTKLTEA